MLDLVFALYEDSLLRKNKIKAKFFGYVYKKLDRLFS